MSLLNSALRKILRMSGTQYQFYDYYYHRKYEELDPFDPLYVSPEVIEFVTGSIEPRAIGHLDYNPYFMPKTSSWKLTEPTEIVDWKAKVSGDWDCTTDLFEELIIYRSIHNRFQNKVPWEETKYYMKHKQRIKAGNTTYCDSVEVLIEKCNRIDELYDSMRTKGYQSQQALDGRPDHEIAVNIGREGRLLYNSEGRHRLSIAKVLGLDNVPVIVLAKHPEAPDISELDIKVR